ncbi:MAG TPA: cyclic-di-AMP receptor [Thermomicrobiales bacterium]
MKLIIAVIHAADADAVLRALSARGFRATVIDSTGGLLRQGNVTILIGVQETLVAEAMRVLRQHCQTRTRYMSPHLSGVELGEYYVSDPVEVQVGGATVYVVDVERYERIA